MGSPVSSPFTRQLDRDAHRALVARVLRIAREEWAEIVGQFLRNGDERESPEQRLARLAGLVASRYPAAAALPGGTTTSTCPACASRQVARRFRRDFTDPALAPYTYAACAGCGHAVLLEAEVPLAAYASPAYYQAQGADGAGYADYETERPYREAKGEALVRWAIDHSAPTPATLLEVGSAFGFTRQAAERLGLRTAGVDLNPHAADAARRLYGLRTHVGTLAHALETGALASGARGTPRFDLVLYDFVLEHVADPAGELQLAAGCLSPQGTLVLRIPGMDALELVPFGALYRSFRRDHLHLFSRDSIARMLSAVGLSLSAYHTSCGADLLREVLPEDALRASYAEGRGPDITLCAVKAPHAPPTRHPA